MRRVAALDVGTNTVLLLLADVDAKGALHVVEERESIPRLGAGVDAHRRLAPERMDATVDVVASFTAAARARGAHDIRVAATSAARDATNRAELQAKVLARTGLHLEVLSGEDEAALCYLAVQHALGAEAREGLGVIDIGGGSTEVIFGLGSRILWKESFALGSVRLTERFTQEGAFTAESWASAQAHARSVVQGLPRLAAGSTVVGVAATVLSLLSVHRAESPGAWGDGRTTGASLHGETLARTEAWAVTQRLAALGPSERRGVLGLDPRRADVLPMGGLVLDVVLEALGAKACRVTDRGLRYGLLLERFGPKPRAPR